MGGRTSGEPKFSPTCRTAHLPTCPSFRLGRSLALSLRRQGVSLRERGLGMLTAQVMAKKGKGFLGKVGMGRLRSSD